MREQAEARKRQKEALEAQAAARDRLFWGLSLGLGSVVFLGGLALMIYTADKLANG